MNRYEQNRNALKSAIARMTEQELKKIPIPLEFAFGTPRYPKFYPSRRDHLVAFITSCVDRMSVSQLMELRVPARYLFPWSVI